MFDGTVMRCCGVVSRSCVVSSPDVYMMMMTMSSYQCVSLFTHCEALLGARLAFI